MPFLLFQSTNQGSAILASLIAIVYFISRALQKTKSKLSNLPTVGEYSQSYLQQDIIDASFKYPTTPYLLPDLLNKPRTLILPIHYLDEIKSLPETKVSFVKSLQNRWSGKYSTLGSHDQNMIDCIKVDLTRQIARTLEALQEEADLAIPACIGECEDWTPVQFYPKVLRIIALLSGRVFVGLPLSRNEEWIDATINYTMAAFACAAPVQKLSPLTRDWVAPSLPEVQRVNQYRSRGAELLKPILEERREKMKVPGFEPPTDMLQFLIQNSKDENHDETYHSYTQMMISLAAIHSTAMNVTHALYDLATHPEYVGPLREELEEVLAADNKVLIKTSMTKLRKMDSFIKESQRMNPPNAISMNRIATSDLTLSSNLFIPKGTAIAFSSIGINNSPHLYPSPETFLPFRFSDLRSAPENTNKYQLVTTGKDAIAFGHGSHACPGRFFASNEIKVILAGLLMRYDVKLREGEGRPENVCGRTAIAPNPKAEVLFRKRGMD